MGHLWHPQQLEPKYDNDNSIQNYFQIIIRTYRT